MTATGPWYQRNRLRLLAIQGTVFWLLLALSWIVKSNAFWYAACVVCALGISLAVYPLPREGFNRLLVRFALWMGKHLKGFFRNYELYTADYVQEQVNNAYELAKSEKFHAHLPFCTECDEGWHHDGRPKKIVSFVHLDHMHAATTSFTAELMQAANTPEFDSSLDSDQRHAASAEDVELGNAVTPLARVVSAGGGE